MKKPKTAHAVTAPLVREDLTPDAIVRLHNLHTLAGIFRAKGITEHREYPQLTLAGIEDEIAMLTGHTHESYGGVYCIHCGWPVAEQRGATP